METEERFILQAFLLTAFNYIGSPSPESIFNTIRDPYACDKILSIHVIKTLGILFSLWCLLLTGSVFWGFFLQSAETIVTSGKYFSFSEEMDDNEISW